MRRVQGGGGARFTPKTPVQVVSPTRPLYAADFPRDKFDGGFAPDEMVPGQPDFAHASAGYRANKPIAAELPGFLNLRSQVIDQLAQCGGAKSEQKAGRKQRKPNWRGRIAGVAEDDLRGQSDGPHGSRRGRRQKRFPEGCGHRERKYHNPDSNRRMPTDNFSFEPRDGVFRKRNG
jgi:hypothetical protein